MFMKKYKQQRGAMFGLDARIALAIFAGLSVITGASMVQLMKDNRADKVLFLHEKVSSAFDVMQEDLRMDIYNNALASSSAEFEDMYLALFDESVLTAAAQSRWHGPYMPTKNSNLDDEYGSIRIKPISRESTGTATCSTVQAAAKECSYFLILGNTSITLPVSVRTAVNEQIDGAGEANPESNGKVRWDVNNLVYIEMGHYLK